MKPVRKYVRVAVATVGFGLVALTSARAEAACPKTGASYATAFTHPDSAWDTRTQAKIGNGTFDMFPGSGMAASFLYHAKRFSDGTICADFDLKRVTGTDASAGIVFWASDLSNYYYSNYEPVTKKLSIGRWADGKPTIVATPMVVGWPIDSGKPIELSVKVAGPEALVYVNGHRVFAIPGDHPDTWYAGLHGEASSDGDVLWSVADFSVTK